jgi:quinol monooxygenase YgiN
MRIEGDTAAFRKAVEERGDEFAAHSERARAGGCIHHRFGIGEDHVVVVDEWESAEQFERFFGDPELQAFIESTGAAAGPPQLTITEAISSADQF